MTVNMSALHNWHHEDYDVAKKHIWEQLGDISGMALFGRQVMVAVYQRPGEPTASGVYRGSANLQKNDWWEGKASLIIATGPSAFTGTDAYLAATYPDGVAPQIGDWVITNANSGIQMNIQGEGGQRIKYDDRHGEIHDSYPDAGWPVRIILDDSILMMVDAPAQVI